MRLYIAIIIFLGSLGIAADATAKMLYGFYIPEKVLEQKLKTKLAADAQLHPLTASKENYIVAIEKKHPFQDHSLEFTVFVCLLSVIGIFRLANPSYLSNLFRAFRNPSLSTRQLKEQLRLDSPASIVMDVIFCISFGLYLYFLLGHIHNKNWITSYPAGFILFGFILLFILIYAIRFLFLKFTGWVFHIREITDSYTFNIFLINKILGLALVPFTIILAFGEGQWVQASLFVSLLVTALLFLNRYLRSGATFGHFLKFSKFHFFMYLCASEILPFAVLLKLVNVWLIS